MHFLWPLIHQEFRMYHYHLSESTQELGWLRGMWHSNIQQLIRQALSYYMAYFFFRPDHAWRLISYPYYAKSTKAGQNTKFRNLDINVQDYLDTGSGGNLLQGTVSFTQEDKKNCTTMLKGMHKTECLSDTRQRILANLTSRNPGLDVEELTKEIYLDTP